MSEMGAKYDRDYARRRRARLNAAARRGQQRCPYTLGRLVCNARLELVVLRDGYTELHCPRCARREAGLCEECPSPVHGMPRKAIRCEAHLKAAQRASTDRYRALNKVTVNEKAKLYQRGIRERASAYKKLWRAANPEKIKAQKRRHSLTQPKRLYAYLRKYRRTHDEKRYVDGRPCLGGCGMLLKGMAKKCTDCKTAARQRALRAIGKAA